MPSKKEDIFYHFYLTAPVDIIEAARIDGLSEVQIFFRMFIPTMKSTYAAAAVITFMNAWNAYLWPKVIRLAMSIGIVIARLSDMITFGHKYAFHAFMNVITAAAA